MSQKESTEKLGKSWFRNLIAQLWPGLLPIIPLLTRAFISEVEKVLPSGTTTNWSQWCDSLAKRKIIDTDTAELIKTLQDDPFPMDFIQMVMTRIAVFKSNVESVMNIYSLDRQYDNLYKTTPSPAPVEMLVRAMMTDPKRSTENRAQLMKHGFDKTQIDNIILAHYKMVEEGTIRTCYLRGIIDETVMFERMRELGYTDTRTKEIVQTWVMIPGPGDLFMMVAKEAFEPTIYKPLGLDKEFPTEQLPWLQKQGISKDWAEKYWIAHWDQPSIGQGFEMLHRDVITPAELDLLFKAVEIPSFWRDKLTQIAYNPYTRVDARRMHAVGTLDTVDLLKAYTDIGYDSEKAAKMVDFTLKFNMGSEKELTRGAILSSYESGLINRTTAKDLLMSQDYSATLADYYLTMSDFNISKETQDLLFENIRQKFLIYKLTTTQVTSSLTKMGLDSNRISALLANWDLMRYQYELLPSKSELTTFLLRNIISEAQYRGIMKQHGYDAASINWYLQEIITESTLQARRPTKAELGRFLKKGIIQPVEYTTEMTAQGYSDKYITYYIADISKK